MPANMARYSERTASFWTLIATNSVTINLTTHAQSPRDGVGNAAGHMCRAIIITKPGTGTLKVVKGNSASETFTTLQALQELPIQCRAILPASAFSEILVLW